MKKPSEIDVDEITCVLMAENARIEEAVQADTLDALCLARMNATLPLAVRLTTMLNNSGISHDPLKTVQFVLVCLETFGTAHQFPTGKRFDA